MTDLTEEDMLVRAVCDGPDDDTPRLVYADWCRENGKWDRGEFINKQVAFAALEECLLSSTDDGRGPKPCRCPWHTLRIETAKLACKLVVDEAKNTFIEQWVYWANRLVPLVKRGRGWTVFNSLVVWRRGFAETVVVDYEVWAGLHPCVWRREREEEMGLPCRADDHPVKYVAVNGFDRDRHLETRVVHGGDGLPTRWARTETRLHGTKTWHRQVGLSNEFDADRMLFQLEWPGLTFLLPRPGAGSRLI